MNRDSETHGELVRRIAETSDVPMTVVERFLNEDMAFREIWDEFERCRAMAKQWRATLPRHLDRIDEYSSLSHETEAEIRRYLENSRDAKTRE